MNPSFCCASCHFRFRVEERFFGRRIRCPNPQCKQPILLNHDSALEETKPSASAPLSSASAPTVSPQSTATSMAKLRSTTATVANPLSRAIRATAGPRVVPADRPPLRTPAGAARGTSQTESRSRSRLRAAVADRSTAQSAATPMMIVFGATLMLGGIALGGYGFWNQQADLTTARGNDDSTTTGTIGSESSPQDSRSVLSPSKAVADNADSLAAATPASTVNAAALRSMPLVNRNWKTKFCRF